MDDVNLVEQLAKFGTFFVPFLFALCFHEYAHGWVARLKGDRTAEMMGRLTLNPMAHLDWIGTVLLPAAAFFFHFPFFGWAKPVPINSRNLKHPREDMFWIALAGPLSNILLAVVAAVLILPAVVVGLGVGGAGKALIEMLQDFILINLFLAFFNLIPLHPLDGGKIVARFLPYNWNHWLDENQGTLSWVLFIVFLMGGFRFLAVPVSWTAQELWNCGAHLVQMVV